MHTLPWKALALSMLVLGLTSQAETRKLGTAVVALDPGLEGEALALWVQLQARVEKDPRYTPLDLLRSSVSDLAARKAEAEKAKTAHAAALAAFDEVKLPKATEKVNEAISAFEGSDLTQAFPDFVESMVLKSLILQVRRDSALQSELRRLFTLVPDHRFQSSRLNPAFTKVAEDIRAKVLATPKTSLKVESPDTSALVFVDGTYRGVAPLEVNELLPGQHFVTVMAPGFDLFQSPAPTGKVLTAKLTPAVEGKALLAGLEHLRAGFRQKTLSEGGAELMRWSAVDELLVVALAAVKGGNQATVVRFLANGVHLEKTIALDSPPIPEPVVQEAKALLDQSAAAAQAAQLSSVESIGPGGLSARTGAYVALGAGGAALVGGVLLGLSAQSKAADARKLPQTDQVAYDRLASSARASALGADALYAVALAGAGLGTWLLVTGRWPGSSAPAPQRAALVPSVAPAPGGGAIVLNGQF